MITGQFRIAAQPEKILRHIRKTETCIERGRGLLGCSLLEEGHGMLISPCNSIHTFFMKIPLDIIYLDRSCRIVAMRENMQPYRFSMCRRASSVLELMAGQIHISGLRKGDHLQWIPQP